MPDAKKRRTYTVTPEQAARRAKIERLWREGRTAAEICKAVGIVAKNPNAVINTYRARGYDLPHRQDVKRVASSKRERWPGKRRKARAA